MRNQDKLSEDAKTYIVEALARHDTPSTVAAAVKAEFGLELKRQAVEAYDPTKKAGGRLSDKWRVHFEKTRKAFLEDINSIPISRKAVRLRRLEHLFERADKNLVLQAALLEQAAKEMGGVYIGRSAPSAEQSASTDQVRPRYPGADRIAEIAALYSAPAVHKFEGAKQD